MTERIRTTHFRFWLWLIRLIGVIVPRRLRSDWRQEWEAELLHREEMLTQWDRLNWRSRLRLLWRSASAFWDALRLQTYRWEDAMIQDLRFCVRMLLKNPGFTLIAVCTLALGIGVNTALFTVYDAFVLKPLPLKDPYSMVNVSGYDRDGKRTRLFSYLDYLDYRDGNTAFDGLTAWNEFLAPFGEEAPTGSDSLLVPGNFGVGELVSGNYFSVLGAEMALGRGFAPEEDRTPNTHPVLILSYSFWTRHFNSDPSVVGQNVRLAGHPFTVIGVTAPGFIGVTPNAPQFWVPLMMRDQVVGNWNHGEWLTERRADSFVLTARLKPEVTFAQAQAEMNVIAERISRTYPDIRSKGSIRLSPGATFLTLEDGLTQLVPPILTAIGLVLLLACVNVTNMLLARAVGRQREIAVRSALGASRMRIVRQLLTESVLLGAVGGMTGFLLAVWAIHLIYPLVLAQLPVPPAMIEDFALDLSPDYRVFGFALFVSLLAGIAAGLAPALQSSRSNLMGALKNEGSTFGAHLSQSRLRNALVVVQIAVCLPLLIAAGLLTRNLQKLRTIDTGVISKNVFTINLSAQGTEPSRVNELYGRLATYLRALPGVKSVSVAYRQPFAGPNLTTPITIPEQAPTTGHLLQANYNFVSADYFQTLGLRFTRGRGFTEQEVQANSPVVVISESTARRFWPLENPLGKRIGIGVTAPQSTGGTADATPNFPSYEIIGLTNDTRQGLIWRPDETFLYIPLRTEPANVRNKGEYLIVSTENDPRPVMAATRNEAAALDSKLVVMVFLVDSSLTFQMTPFQAIALLAGVLGALALLLACVGLYGVMSFIVSQRTHEIGIRMALGAQYRDVIALFLKRGTRLIAVGVVIGLAGGVAISSLLAVALTDISQVDFPTFGIVTAFLTIVALSACYFPARRATQVDPMTALRHE
jgi:macrolide transport system ATP-binding/permease protein